ncbi:hypothetical protein D3C85_941250 [compost metagenome]
MQAQGEVADLVEEEGATVGLADPAEGAFAGAGEGAAVVAEQLTLHQLGGKRGAVDGDERFLRPLAPSVNGAGQLALAGAGLAEDEDIGVGAGYLAGGFQHRHHRRALGFKDVASAAHLTLQRLQARGELTHLQLLGRGHAQLVRAAGLDQVIGRTGLHGVHRRVYRRVRGDYHHPHPGGLDAHLSQHVEAVVFAQAQVEEAEIEYLPLQQRLGLGRTGGGGHAVAFVLQAVAEGAQNGGFVIHQQYASLVLGYRFHALTPFPSHRS